MMLCACSLMISVELLMLPAIPMLSLPRRVGAASVSSPAALAASASASTAAAALRALGASSAQRPAALDPLSSHPPNISVIVPCYGHAAFLEETLVSVMEQQYPPAEIIVVDDGSDDRCGAVAQKLLSETLAARRKAQAGAASPAWARASACRPIATY